MQSFLRPPRWPLPLLVASLLFTACDDDDTTSPGDTVEVTVMTRNIYLGANIFRLAEAQSFQQVPVVAAQLFATVVATDFPQRAEALADEIEATRPALIGLQEVSLYRIQQVSDFQTNPTPNAQDVRFDFLQILVDELQSRGLDYSVAAQVQNTDQELPAVLNPADPTALSDIRLTDFDVILARSDVQTSGVVEANFNAAAQVPVGGAQIPFLRGYTKLNAEVDGAEFTFVNTHLEGLMPAHQAQANEFRTILQSFSPPVVLVGDLNTGPGTTTPGYDILVTQGPFTDAFTAVRTDPGFTCCFSETLMDANNDALDERIDLILFRGNVDVVSADVVGEELTDRTAGGLRPSDHAGVVATLRIPR